MLMAIGTGDGKRHDVVVLFWANSLEPIDTHTKIPQNLWCILSHRTIKETEIEMTVLFPLGSKKPSIHAGSQPE